MKRKPSAEEKESQARIKYLIDTYCGGNQQRFAERVGIGKSSVSQYVNGTNFPGNIRAGKIAETFSVNPVWVMGFDVPMYVEKDISVRSAHVGAKRIRDPRLTDALEKYFELSESEKQNVIDYIDFVYNKSKQ